MRNEEISSIFEILIALDSLAAKLCVERITDQEIQLLFDKVNEIKDAQTSGEAIRAAFEFQHEFALCSGNTLIPLVFQSFYSPIHTMWERFCDLYGIEVLYQRNYKMWTYLRDRNLNGAIEWIEKSMAECISGEYQIYYD